MITDPTTISKALLQSLIEAPLLVDQLPEATVFPRLQLGIPTSIPPLNLQQKLGHLYEDALALLLKSSPHFDLLEQSLQIQKDIHTTVGELDFLLRDLATDQLIHLELATKFYLAVDTPSGLTLPGPDARDNYLKKLTRLRSHQLQLPTLFKDHLPEKYRYQSIVTQHLIHGCLFDHIHAPTPASPEFITPDCRRGKWLHLHEIPTHFPPNTAFQIIPKPLWPVPLNLLENIPLKPWAPDTPIDRCLMIKPSYTTIPHFIAPSDYPDSTKTTN